MNSSLAGFPTPVLLIAWRRPHALRQVIDAIRPLAPSRLFVACDGPNPERLGEEAKVAATRQLIEKEINWPCQIERFYSATNQGCRLGVSNAISWFFKHVDEGIILEDDCVPHPDFFPYCVELLQRYRNDTRVWCISGNNYQDRQWRGDGSYYFSHYPHNWGWASWRRAWDNYDGSLDGWREHRGRSIMKAIFRNPQEADYWRAVWNRLMEMGLPDTWDYQWVFSCMVNSGLTAIPNKNLVQNIGFGEGATHTLSKAMNPHLWAVNENTGLLPIEHPSFVLRDHEADAYDFEYVFQGCKASTRLSKVFRKCLIFFFKIPGRMLHYKCFN